MHNLLSTVALFALGGTLLAQSPFVGTWKVDSAKAKFTAGKPGRSMTTVMEEQGDNLQVTSIGANADGSPFTLKYTVPIKGGAGPSGRLDAVSLKVVSADMLEITFSRGGKEALFRRLVMSNDGKTIRTTETGTNVKGEPIDGSGVLKKD